MGPPVGRAQFVRLQRATGRLGPGSSAEKQLPSRSSVWRGPCQPLPRSAQAGRGWSGDEHGASGLGSSVQECLPVYGLGAPVPRAHPPCVERSSVCSGRGAGAPPQHMAGAHVPPLAAASCLRVSRTSPAWARSRRRDAQRDVEPGSPPRRLGTLQASRAPRQDAQLRAQLVPNPELAGQGLSCPCQGQRRARQRAEAGGGPRRKWLKFAARAGNGWSVGEELECQLGCRPLHPAPPPRDRSRSQEAPGVLVGGALAAAGWCLPVPPPPPPAPSWGLS